MLNLREKPSIYPVFLCHFSKKGYSYPILHQGFIQKFIPAKVINQICKSDIKPCACNSDTSHCNAVHCACHKSENVFNSTADFGFFTVVFLLFFGKRMISGSFFANMVFAFFGELFGYFFA